ncbi:RNA polymerase sigma factor (sigma-70 family) [Streptacidiphilus sp. BW17]|uniref:sigma-70 family RNA polymerase sigma factor n=1 Tax=Streptacidiphilus sp. BW17 TaxID=3156274 RepID=UPI0035179829
MPTEEPDAPAAHVPPQGVGGAEGLPRQRGDSGEGPHEHGAADRVEAAAPPSVPPPGGPVDDEPLTTSDADLTAAVRAGDDAAYEELYRRHVAAVRRYARTCCRDSFTAEDLAGEVFARTLQALRAGKGPDIAVRAYLLTAVRNIAASWTRGDRREQLIDDFQLFATNNAVVATVDVTDPGADARAMTGVDQSLIVRAFLNLDADDRLLLWHTEVEQEPPREVAVLLGKTANATAVQAHRARERLATAFLQAHISDTQASDCEQHAAKLGGFARGQLGKRASTDVRAHLQECDRCSAAYLELVDLNHSLRELLPSGLLVWLGSGYFTVLAAGLAGAATAGAAVGVTAAAGGSATTAGATTAGAAGAAGAAGSSGGAAGGAAGGGAASEGVGLPVKIGIATAVVVAAAAGLAFALTGSDAKPKPVPVAKPKPTPVATVPARPAPKPTPKPTPPPPPPPVVKPSPTPTPTPTPKPTPRPTPPPPRPTPKPTPPPPPPPPVTSYYVDTLPYQGSGPATGPALAPPSVFNWVWQRPDGVSIGKKSYARGITVMAPSNAVVDLNRACTNFSAWVGIDDMTMGLGSAKFTVENGTTGAVLWQSGVIHGGDPAENVSVSLKGLTKIKLVVRGSHGFIGGQVADWADARFSC